MLHKADEQKKMNFSLIKMQECMSVKLAIWRIAKNMTERKVRMKSQNKKPISLILKNVKFALSVKGAISKVLKAKLFRHNQINEHLDQEAFQETERFKNLAKTRYKIEAKNSELKHGHGYETARSRVYSAWRFKELQRYSQSISNEL